MTNYMTEQEYIQSQTSFWGEDYVFGLIDSGYTPILTNEGWKWIYDPQGVAFSKRTTGLDTGSPVCYPGSVGVR